MILTDCFSANRTEYDRLQRLLPGSSRADSVQPVGGIGVCSLVLSSIVLATALVTTGRAAEMVDDKVALSEEITQELATPEVALLERMQEIGSVRIVMHSLEPADRLADQLGSLLAALGVAQVERRVVDTVPQSNQVRYYHSVDREAGQAVGEALGLVFDEVAVRDFAHYQPAPMEGLIEVWLR